MIPESRHKYVTDFKVHGVYFETKGYFDPDSRKKMLNVVKSNPGIKVIMVFSHPDKPIRKGSKTTYVMWCDKNGIPWTTLEEFEKSITNKGALNDLLERTTKRMGI